jgi:two-component system LytT family response regulator
LNVPTRNAIRVLVVDDEAPARARLIDMLSLDPEIAAVSEASDGAGAVALIHREMPDLVFLDVQMPELTGLQVIETVGVQQMPLTIFVTAYDQHAIRAFEANALDYLLKPFSDERLEAALLRAKTRLGEREVREFGRSVMQMISSQHPARSYAERLILKSSGIVQFVTTAEIDWIEGAGVYVNLHLADKTLLHRASLNELQDSLDPRMFMRIHRSTIVNVNSIVRLESLSHGEFDVILKNRKRTRVSRTYRAALEHWLGQSL